MNRMKYIAIVILLFGLVYVGFWSMAKTEDRRTRTYRMGDLTQEQFDRQFPVMKLACRFFGFDPFGKPAEDRQITPAWFVHQGIVRHIWIGLSLFFLGGSLITFGASRRLITVLHYVCVVGFGGALFVAAAMHPIIVFWNGK